MRGRLSTASWAPVPLPGPDLPYASLLTALHGWFSTESARMSRHLTGLAGWDQADERTRRMLADLLDRQLPAAAVARYDESHRRLAEEIPEFALWSDRLEARAAARGLERLEALLLRAASGRDPGGTGPRCPRVSRRARPPCFRR